MDKAIVTVHRPVLTKEERDKRQKAIYKAAAELLKHRKDDKNV